jgi:hypothetical protein
MIYVCSQSDDVLISELQNVNVPDMRAYEFDPASPGAGSDASVYRWPAPSEQGDPQNTEGNGVHRGVCLVASRLFKFVQVWRFVVNAAFRVSTTLCILHVEVDQMALNMRHSRYSIYTCMQALSTLLKISTPGQEAAPRDTVHRLQWLQTCISTDLKCAVSAAGGLVSLLIKVIERLNPTIVSKPKIWAKVPVLKGNLIGTALQTHALLHLQSCEQYLPSFICRGACVRSSVEFSWTTQHIQSADTYTCPFGTKH